MADTRSYEIQLVETLRSIGRALGVAGLSSSGSSSSASSSISSNELIVAINGIISRLETNKSYLDVLLERLEYDQDKGCFHLKTGLISDSYIVAAASASFSPGGGGGDIAVYMPSSLEGTTFNPTSEADTFNAFTIQSLHTRIKALEENPGGVSSVAGLTGDVAASDLFTALGLGTAATRAVGAIENANTGLVTGGDVYSFVNSSVATATATFRGTNTTATTEAAFLTWADALTHDLNDYVFWATTDAYGNTVYKRYKYNGSAWVFEYDLNNSSFTAAQWAAINSGITSQKITGYDTVAGYFTNGVLGTANIPQLPTSKITGLDTTLTSISASITALEKMFIDDTYTVDGQTKHRLKVNSAYFEGLITTGFLIGAADGGPGGGGGGGIDLNLMWASLQNTTPDTHATDKFHKNHLPAIVAADGISAGYTLDSGNLATHLNIGISAIDMTKVIGLSTALAGKANTSSLGSMAYASTGDYYRYYGVNLGVASDAKIGAGYGYKAADGWNDWGAAITFGISGHVVQVQGQYSGNDLYFRTLRGDTASFTSWRKIYNSENFVAGTNYQAPISAGTGITISNNTVSVTANTYAPYNSAGYLPLSGGTMSNTNVVTNLNADLLDGINSSGFARASESSMPITNINWLGYGNLNIHSGWPLVGPAITVGVTDYYSRIQISATEDKFYFQRVNLGTGGDWREVYHSGNSNLTSVPWSASSLTLAGAISGVTHIDSLLYFDTTNSRVGIGTSSPSGLFDVNGSICCDTNAFRTRSNYYGFSVESQGWPWYGVKTYMTYDEGQTMGAFRIGTSYYYHGLSIGYASGLSYSYSIPNSATYTDVVYIINGNVGIGDGGPSEKLSVSGNIRTTGNITAFGSISASGVIYSNNIIRTSYFSTNRNAAQFVFDKAGSNLTGIGANNEEDTIYFGACNSSGSWVSYSQKWKFGGVVEASIGFISPGYGNFAASYSSSDQRLKDDIETIKPEYAIEKLMALRPSEWVWNEKSSMAGRKGAGLVAQHVEPVLPWNIEKNGEYLSLCYDMFHPYEIGSIQFLKGETDMLKDEVAELRNRVETLESENKILKERIYA